MVPNLRASLCRRVMCFELVLELTVEPGACSMVDAWLNVTVHLNPSAQNVLIYFLHTIGL